MSSRTTLPFLVAVETDPLRYHGEQARWPKPLESAAAEQLVAHIGADLGKLLPRLGQVSLGLTAALYDQAQILQPGWPVFSAMDEVFRRRQRRRSDGHPDEAALMSIGMAQGHMPRAELTPSADLPPGRLLLIPLLLSGDATELAYFDEQMESRFMEEGQLSPESARALEAAFDVATTHARFLTLTDLLAMLKLQLDHFGFGVLWELLDAALEGAAETELLHGSMGQQFRWDGERVIARFETFDYWARQGGGRDTGAEKLGAAYIDWTREYRQLLVTLGAHGVPVAQKLAGPESFLEGLYFIEEAGTSGDSAPAITEHGGEAMGTVAVTVIHQGQMHHYYPLAPEGSNQLHSDLAGLGVAHQGLSYPGCICFDRQTRRLVADCAG
jgi:hypothetical protein